MNAFEPGVVDGEASVRIVALRALEEAGFSVVTAADGREALALIAQHGPPDLVATDNVVSAVGGQELARQLSARWPDLPIVFLSAYAPDELFPASSERNHSATIQKPFTPGQLTSSVIKTLSYRLAH